MCEYISEATKNNWKRLKKSKSQLDKRANKTSSLKHILPLESISNKDDLLIIENISTYILDNKIDISSAIYSLCVNLLDVNNDKRNNIKKFVSDYEKFELNDWLKNCKLPLEEDFLGVIYQYVLTEGERNIGGIYYTPSFLIRKIFEEENTIKDGFVLDPCCGSGNFLYNAKVISPNQLIGIDNDINAVMIAKARLMVKYKEDFEPNIIFSDFLKRKNFEEIVDKKVIAIFTNPPWGAKNNKDKEDTFSSFIKSSIDVLSDEGKIICVLPESFVKIKAHKNLRKYLIDKTEIDEIVHLSSLFSGVTSPCVVLKCKNTNQLSNKTKIIKNDEKKLVQQSDFLKNVNFNFFSYSENDKSIFETYDSNGYYDLSKSGWYMGIVTGDNKNLVSNVKEDEQWVPIYTGKDVNPYLMVSPSHYLKYDLKLLQQVPKNSISVKRERLLYKFISKKLCFSYDDSDVKLLNSVNAVVPKIEGLSMKTIVGFLNSDLFNFVYIKRFDDIKVLRHNLCLMKFPKLDNETNLDIENSINRILCGNKEEHELLQNKIYKIYGISNLQKNNINNFLKK